MKALIILAAALTTCNASAAALTVSGEIDPVANCIPFGCANIGGPNMGFIYKNLPGFELQPGDTIAFDLLAGNDVPLIFDIALASTTVNGGLTADSDGFTTIASSALGTGQGNSVIGDFDLVFTVDSAFSFDGGGLVINFFPQGITADDSSGNFNLVASSAGDPSGNFAARYFFASTPGVTPGAFQSVQFDRIGHFRLNATSVVPVPAAVWLLLSALGSLLVVRRTKAG